MGNSESALISEKQLEIYQLETFFTRKEILHIYQRSVRICMNLGTVFKSLAVYLIQFNVQHSEFNLMYSTVNSMTTLSRERGFQTLARLSFY